ncbi:GPW/gp25 family protein [Cytophagaceae bacterium DM2B3-1]|uniref:GPW/gp25 family protein n=1 Tax=Xanthocytophaga flava TaxID=3048013 RepID=A0ABT7CIT5_9BACT|nr:GPW/gp25 family protein [Xanthocytophaga flavus]MDJ1469688.1 GPW/gp25 family protein [Xanthocytophaga flavus]MDJ1493636.1 GPW/gp25 family protein [Xanthocytophaga flavus]
MHSNYLKFPIRFSKMLEGKELDTCLDTGDSIAQYLQLLLITRPGENCFDPQFGCAIWDMDFELIVNEGTWKEGFRLAVADAIVRYEKRLENVRVEISIETVERHIGVKKRPELRRKAIVYIRANMVQTGEQFTFSTELFLSPLSVN